jgi:hypothetical protein
MVSLPEVKSIVGGPAQVTARKPIDERITGAGRERIRPGPGHGARLRRADVGRADTPVENGPFEFDRYAIANVDDEGVAGPDVVARDRGENIVDAIGKVDVLGRGHRFLEAAQHIERGVRRGGHRRAGDLDEVSRIPVGDVIDTRRGSCGSRAV